MGMYGYVRVCKSGKIENRKIGEVEKCKIVKL